MKKVLVWTWLVCSVLAVGAGGYGAAGLTLDGAQWYEWLFLSGALVAIASFFLSYFELIWLIERGKQVRRSKSVATTDRMARGLDLLQHRRVGTSGAVINYGGESN